MHHHVNRLSAYHRELITAILDVCGAEFDSTEENVHEIGETLGWNARQVRTALRMLALQGYLKKVKRRRSVGGPLRYQLVDIEGLAA